MFTTIVTTSVAVAIGASAPTIIAPTKSSSAGASCTDLATSDDARTRHYGTFEIDQRAICSWSCQQQLERSGSARAPIRRHYKF